MLYIIGLGLGDERDIILKGLDAVKKCEKVYVEAYTSLLCFGHSNGLSTMEKLYGKPIILADRETCEEKADNILSEVLSSDVAFLVVGDPFGATTHTDLVVRAKTLGVDIKGKKAAINTAIEQLLEVGQKHGESVYDEDIDCVGFADSTIVVSDIADDSTPVKTEGTGRVLCLETKDVEATITKAVGARAVAEGEITEGDGASTVGRDSLVRTLRKIVLF